MALEHQLNIVSLVSAVNKAVLRLWTLICIIRRQDEKKIPFKLFFNTASFPQRYIHINSYTKWLAFFTSLTSHESKSSLESAVHESKSSPKTLFMRLKCDSSPSRRLEFPSLVLMVTKCLSSSSRLLLFSLLQKKNLSIMLLQVFFFSTKVLKWIALIVWVFVYWYVHLHEKTLVISHRAKIQSVLKNLTGLQKAKSLSQKLISKHQWLVHTLYIQKYWDTPFFRTEKGTSKTVETKIVFPSLL